MLADAVSNALADYFVVDKQKMETKLLSNAAVKLHDTELKPRDNLVINATTRASIRGAVQHVSFEWHWGKSQKEGGSDWVKDARLSISGLRFTVTLSHSQEGDIVTPSLDESRNGKESKTGGNPSGFMAYVQDQVQRILDSLTLTVENVLVAVVLPDGSNLQLGASGFEVRSNGISPSEEEPTAKVLQQLFDIKRLYVSITTQKGDLCPVFEDIHYSAKIRRMVGNRFESGIKCGVFIEGRSDERGLVIHAGSRQLEILNALAGMLVSTSEAQTGNSSNTNVTSSKESPVAAVSSESSGAQVDLESNQPSFMGLTLSEVSLVLPNGARLSLSGLFLKYRMDGTQLQLESNAGFEVDGFPFLSLGETCMWAANFVERQFVVDDLALAEDGSVDDEVVVFVNARQSEIQRVSDGINQALNVYRRLTNMDRDEVAEVEQNPRAAPKEGNSQRAWSLHLNGKIGCILQQDDQSEIIMTMRHLMVDTQALTLKLKSIDELHIPDVLHLVEPIVDSSILFDGMTVKAMIQEVVLILNDSSTSDEEDRSSKNQQQGSSLSDDYRSEDDKGNEAVSSTLKSTSQSSLPFGFELQLNKFLAFKADGITVHTTMDTLYLEIKPLIHDYSESNPKNASNVNLHLRIKEINHDMIRLKQPQLRLCVEMGSSFDSIYNLNFGASEIAVAAGYSVLDWKEILPKPRRKDHNSKPLCIPYAHIEKLKVVVLVKGLIGVKDSVLHVHEFHGDNTATVKDIISFYNAQVVAQVPGMIAHTSILGANVGDGIVSQFGGGLLAKAVGSAGIGSLVSVAAFDSVKNTIKAGKVSRGVDEAERFQISDLALGLKYTARRAAREGAAMRGKDDEDGTDPIDWAVGATNDIAKYSSENKSRLAGAGAGAVGFAYGFMLGGPVGAIAGTVIASAGTQKTVDHVDNVLKKRHNLRTSADGLVIDTNSRATNTRVELQGFLLKRRNFVTWDWRPHGFILTADGKLEYYKLMEKPPKGKAKPGVLYMDSSRGPQKILNLERHRVKTSEILSIPDDSLFVFTINIPEQREPLWTLAAPSEELRSKWVSALGAKML